MPAKTPPVKLPKRRSTNRNYTVPRPKFIAPPDCFIYRPRDFDPAAYPGPIADHPDAAIWFLSTIWLKRVMNVHRARSSFVQLKTDYLGAIMNKNIVHELREALIEAGLIETDGFYIAGEKAYGYRLPEHLSGPGVWTRHAVANKHFARRVADFRQGLKVESPANPLLQAHMQKWVELCGFTESVPAALEEISDEPFKPTKNRQPHEFPNRQEFARAQVMVVEGGFRRIKRDRHGRVHTNFTTLVTELRSCLQINGEPLFEVDIAASQIYMLGLLVLRKWVIDRDDRGDNTTTGRERVYGSNFVPDDLARMFKDVQSGKFYERFQAIGKGYKRDQAKRNVFQVLMGNVKLMEDSPTGKRFKKLYPAVYAELVQMKSRNPFVGKKGVKGQKPFAWVGQQLQSIESGIVIDGVAENLRLNFPHVPFLTIHDSFLTTERHFGLVKELLANAFKGFPYQPTFRSKEPFVVPPLVTAA